MQIHVHLSQPGVCLSAWSLLRSFPVTDAVCVSPSSQQQHQGKPVAYSFATGAPSIIWSVSVASLSTNVAVTFTEAPLFWLSGYYLMETVVTVWHHLITWKQVCVWCQGEVSLRMHSSQNELVTVERWLITLISGLEAGYQHQIRLNGSQDKKECVCGEEYSAGKDFISVSCIKLHVESGVWTFPKDKPLKLGLIRASYPDVRPMRESRKSDGDMLGDDLESCSLAWTTLKHTRMDAHTCTQHTHTHTCTHKSLYQKSWQKSWS